MGTWDTGPFDNDTAADWSGEFDDASVTARLEMIEEALRAAAEEPDYLEARFACEAVAAAAVVASQLPGGPEIDSPYGPDFLTEGGTLDLPAGLPALALLALDRVVEEDSQWRDQWEGSDQLDQAIAALEPLRAGLRRAGAAHGA